MKKLLLFGMATLLFALATPSPALAVQGICSECQWNVNTNRWYCYYINSDGYDDCFVFQNAGACGTADVCRVN